MPSSITPGLDERPDGFAPVVQTQRVRRVLDSVDTLPALPTVVLRVMELADDADAKASDFEKLLAQDPGLAARVLKLVNSPFFGLRHEVTSIAHAVVLLGFRNLRSIVVAAKTSRLLNRQLAPYGFNDGGMWKHSMSCATICHFLAKRLKLDPRVQDRLFLAGLMHDIGKIVVAPQISEVQARYDIRLRENDRDVPRTEREIVGVSHDDIGGRMTARWGLDVRLCALVAGHHAPPRSAESAVLRIANDLCHELGIGRAAGPRAASPARAAWMETAGLSGAPGMLRELERPLAELQAVFESVAGA